MIKFEIKPHKVRRGEVVEITKDGALIGTVTVDENTHEIRVLSKYLTTSEASPSPILGVVPGLVRVFLKL